MKSNKSVFGIMGVIGLIGGWMALHPVETMDMVNKLVSTVKDVNSLLSSDENKKEKNQASQSQTINGNNNTQQLDSHSVEQNENQGFINNGTMNVGNPYSPSSFYNPAQALQFNSILEKHDLQGSIDKDACGGRTFAVQIILENHQSPKPRTTVDCGSNFTIKDVEGKSHNTVRYVASALGGKLVDSENFILWGTVDTNIVNLKPSRN